MQIRPLLMKKIKEIHILTVGGVPGISNFKSRASPPWEGNEKYDINTLILKIPLHVFHQNVNLRPVSYKQDA